MSSCEVRNALFIGSLQPMTTGSNGLRATGKSDETCLSVRCKLCFRVQRAIIGPSV